MRDAEEMLEEEITKLNEEIRDLSLDLQDCLQRERNEKR